jgi:hypothetical protein
VKPVDDRSAQFRSQLKKRIREACENAADISAPPPLKCTAELSPSDAALELWWRGLIFDYSKFRNHFEHWWKSVSSEEQKRLNIAVESFESYDQWMRARQASGRRRGGIGSVLLSDAEYSYARSLHRDLASLTPSAPEIQRSFHEAKIRKNMRDSYRKAALAFRVRDGRSNQNEKRDRGWSKLRYKGISEKDIATKYLREQNSDRNPSASKVRKAVKAHRERNLSSHWALRLAMSIIGFPPAELTLEEHGARETEYRKEFERAVLPMWRKAFPDQFGVRTKHSQTQSRRRK